MRGHCQESKKRKRGLPACGLLFLSFAIVSPVQAADSSARYITVDDIYRTAIERSADGRISLRCTNKKGESLPSGQKKDSSQTSGKTSLPVSYDLRREGAVTSIKDQGYSGSCWAFASLKSLESNLLKTNTAPSSIDLSENHLSWYLFNPSKTASDPMYLDGISFREDAARTAYQAESNAIKNSYNFSSYYQTLPYIKGSNALLGTFVLARWSGALSEAAAPFNAVSTKNLFTMAETMKKQSDNLRYQADYYLTDSNCYDNAPQDEIKSALMNSGALEASFYYSNNNLTENSDGTFAYLSENKKTADANHSITIIGWDDNYSKEHFGGHQPERDGAWLIANSYGTSFGQDGFFWLSYEDASLGEIYSFTGTVSSNYDNNYQYDGSGWGSALLPKKDFPMKVANIFSANKKYTQSLRAVALYTVTPEQPYTVKIYKNVSEGNPTGGTLAATLTGTEKYSGYHTIPLPTAVPLKANERFSVVVSYHQTNDNNGYIPIEGMPLYSSSLTMNFHSTPGKSYCYANAVNAESGESSYQWTDLNLTPVSASENGERNIYNNVCIKAFTVNTKKAGSIHFSPDDYTLGTGEKITLSPVIKDTDKKTITYSINKPSVAKVKPGGKIKAKKKGNATITGTLPTGAYSTLSLKVKAAPRNIRLTAKNKKIKVGRSVKIRVKLPLGSASSTISFRSSNPKIAKIDKNGRITGKFPGTAKITAKTYNNKKAQIKIIVRK